MKALRGSRAGLIVVLGLLSWSTARGLARSVVVLEEFLSGLDRPIAVKNQEFSFYQYRNHILHPLLIFDADTGDLVCAVLRPGNKGADRAHSEASRGGHPTSSGDGCADDGSGRLFVLERAGRIRVIREGALLPTPFLDISDRVDTIGEGGLMPLTSALPSIRIFGPSGANQYCLCRNPRLQRHLASPAGEFLYRAHSWVVASQSGGRSAFIVAL